jgi:hypothetical protein
VPPELDAAPPGTHCQYHSDARWQVAPDAQEVPGNALSAHVKREQSPPEPAGKKGVCAHCVGGFVTKPQEAG